MKPTDFQLQHADIPQTTLLDEEIATTNWPMPPARPWKPRPMSTWDRVKRHVADAIEQYPAEPPP